MTPELHLPHQSINLPQDIRSPFLITTDRTLPATTALPTKPISSYSPSMDLHAVVEHCNNCNSLEHTTPACPQPTLPARQRVCNIMSTPGPDPLATEEPISNYLQHKTTQPLELHFRTLLAPPKDPSEYHTTTTGARQCPTHHAMQQQLENEANSKAQSQSQAPPSSTTPTTPSPFSTTFLKPSARPLLPLCATCTLAETELKEILIPPGEDLCRCATMIAQAACPNCVIEAINGEWKVAQGEGEIGEGGRRACYVCRKGEMGEGRVRMCVYCKGVVVGG